MANSAGFEAIESVQYLYLREILEPRDSSLKLVVEEAFESSGDSRSSASSAALTKYSPIESTRGRTFELYWPTYVAYLVTEAPAGSNASAGHADESYAGRLLRRYSKSHFLDHLACDTGGHASDILHYKLICLNHLVDVAAYVPPEIRVLNRPAEKKPPASRHIGGIIGPY